MKASKMYLLLFVSIVNMNEVWFQTFRRRRRNLEKENKIIVKGKIKHGV